MFFKEDGLCSSSFFKKPFMNYLLKKYSDLGLIAEISAMEPQGKAKEFHVIMHITQQKTNFDQQLLSLYTVLQKLLTDPALYGASTISARCFLSDATNQQELAEKLISELLNCPVSYVKQPPMDGSKLALWFQMQPGLTKANDGLAYAEHNEYRHYYSTGELSLNNKNGTAYNQTLNLLETYEAQLINRGCSIEKDCIRTWFEINRPD